LLAFQKKTARLQRAVLGSIEAAQEAQNRAKHVKKAIEDTPGADPKLATEVRRIEQALGEVLVALQGDRAMARRNEVVPTSISERVSAIVSSHWSTSAPPTGTNLKGYAFAAEAFEKELAKLRTLVETDLRALETALEKAGGPWTPGRVPTWVKE
jgi:hypothetical protein